jgi:signal transduction histidine kinase
LKRIAPILLLMLCGYMLPAQQWTARADSLNTLLGVARDTTRVRLLNELSLEVVNYDPEAAQKFSKDAMTLSQKQGYEKGIAYSWHTLGGWYFVQGNYAKEIECYLQALEIREKLGDPRDISQSLNSIGNSYFTQKEYTPALDYYNQAREIRAKMKDPRGEAVMLNNIGNIHLALDEYKDAEKAYSKALEINSAEGNKPGIGTNLYNLGLVAENQKELAKAQNYYLKSLNVRREINSASGVATVYNSIGDVHRQMGDYQQAIRYFQKAQETAKSINGRKWIQDSYEGMAATYEKMGDYQSAYQAHKEYSLLKDSLFSEESSQAIRTVRTSYEAEKKDSEEKLKALEEEAQRQRELQFAKNFGYIAIAAFIVAAGLVFVLIWRFRMKQRANQQLEKRVETRTEELRQANGELNTFVYKSSHDLKSPLTSIKGLVGIARVGSSQEATEKYLPMIENRVEHLDNILSNLINTVEVRERLLERVPLDFQLLINEAISAQRSVPGYSNVEFTRNIRVGREIWSDKTVVSAILRHLISNSVVFSRTHGATCHIEINAAPGLDADKFFTIIVADNGSGIPAALQEKVFEMFYRGSNQSRGSGLGLYIVKKSLEKLNGELTLVSEEGKGTIVTIRIPG